MNDQEKEKGVTGQKWRRRPAFTTQEAKRKEILSNFQLPRLGKSEGKPLFLLCSFYNFFWKYQVSTPSLTLIRQAFYHLSHAFNLENCFYFTHYQSHVLRNQTKKARIRGRRFG
jgi:hypothetical protein